MHNFTYRHSDLPPIRAEIQAEIVALDVQLADLILKSQGNYKELDQLAEILDDCLVSCELNIRSIRIIPDDNPQSAQSPATITDLSIQEQTIVFGTAFFGATVLATLQKLTGIDMDLLTSQISEQVSVIMEDISDEQITESLKDYLKKHREHPMQQTFKIKVPGA